MISLLSGHVIAMLPTLAAASVQTCITSPPYWGLRDYGTDPVPWTEVRYRPMPGLDAEVVVPAGLGSLGMEATPTAYVGHLVAVFREVARVLRKDGTLWLNLGDAYCTILHGPQRRNSADPKLPQREAAGQMNWQPIAGFKHKDLLPLPWLVAFALQADGWYLRAWLPWVKRNPMPGSQRDRPTASCEVVFLLGHPESQGRYVYDAEAVKQPVTCTRKPGRKITDTRKTHGLGGGNAGLNSLMDRYHAGTVDSTRTWRTADAFFSSLQAILDGGQGLLSNDEGDPLALVVNTQPYKGAHFAVFPPSLVEPCIHAGAPEHGCCPTCGTAWARAVQRRARDGSIYTGERAPRTDAAVQLVADHVAAEATVAATFGTRSTDRGNATKNAARIEVLGYSWRPGCACPANTPVPCTVLDPFGGAGSVAVAAEKLGRSAVLIELSSAYCEQTAARVRHALRRAD